MRKTIFSFKLLLISLIAATASAQAQDKPQELVLTFQEAYQQMHLNSHVLKQSGFQIKEKEADVKAKNGLRTPRVSIMANAVQMADPLHLDLTPVRDAINPLYTALGKYGNFSGVPNPDPNTSGVLPTLPDNISTQAVRSQLLEAQEAINAAEWDKMIQEKQFAAVNANILWPIYTGGKINAAVKAAKLEKEDAELSEELKQSELLSELVTRYYGLTLAQQAVTVRQQVLEAMKKHLYDAQKLSEQGQIAKVEFLHAQVAVADAERELKKSEREFEIVKRALQNTLVIEESSALKVVSPLFILKKFEDENYFNELAKANNTYMKMVESKKALASVGVQYEKSNYMPSLALAGTYNLANKDLSPYMPDWTVGLGLQWTVFEGNARHQKLQAAKFKESQASEAGMKVEDDVKTGIRKYYQEMQMQTEQLDGLDKTLEFANAYADSQEKAFKEGLATSSALVDARLLVAKTKIDRLQAMYKFDVSLASLLQLCGKPELFIPYLTSDNIKNESF